MIGCWLSVVGCRLSVFGIWLSGTVFQTAALLGFINPETSSRVTLATLGTVFQTNLLTNNKTTIQLNDKTTNLAGSQYRAQRE